jgi:hypothetical protein
LSGRTEIHALHEDYVFDLLVRVGLSGEFEAGRLTCSVCGGPINDLGLGAIKLVDREPIVACGRLECLREFHG